MGKSSGDTKSLFEIKEDLRTFFQAHQLDQFSGGRTEDEETSRDVYADEIINKYMRDPATGHPEDITVADRAMVTALRNGIEAVRAEPTITDAFKQYLKENVNPDQYKREQQLTNFGRIEREALAVWRVDLPLTKITRQDAKALRDSLLARMKPSSAKRQMNNIKAVMAFGCREFQVPFNDAFLNMTYPREAVEDREKRLPLPNDIIAAMYVELTKEADLSDLWTLIHHTGAQNAELLSLEIRHIKVDHKVPHIAIEATETRSLKDGWRKRVVPLVGKALEVAQRIVAEAEGRQFAFPKYAQTNRHDLFSAEHD